MAPGVVAPAPIGKFKVKGVEFSGEGGKRQLIPRGQVLREKFSAKRENLFDTSDEFGGELEKMKTPFSKEFLCLHDTITILHISNFKFPYTWSLRDTWGNPAKIYKLHRPTSLIHGWRPGLASHESHNSASSATGVAATPHVFFRRKFQQKMLGVRGDDC